jgi:uncharacterized membrane protein
MMPQIIDDEFPRSSVRARALPLAPYQGANSFYLLSILFSVPLVCFAGALFSDLAYIKDPDIQWSNFSSWLLAFGLLFLGISIAGSLLHYGMTMKRARKSSQWLFGLILIAAFITGLFDNFIHSHDGWTSVWPVGVSLSALTLLFLVVALVLKLTSLTNSYLVDAS